MSANFAHVLCIVKINVIGDKRGVTFYSEREISLENFKLRTAIEVGYLTFEEALETTVHDRSFAVEGFTLLKGNCDCSY